MTTYLQSAVSFGLRTFEENQRFETSRASLIDLETELSKHNSCTVDYEQFREYVSMKSKYQIELSRFYEQLTFRKMR